MADLVVDLEEWQQQELRKQATAAELANRTSLPEDKSTLDLSPQTPAAPGPSPGLEITSPEGDFCPLPGLDNLVQLFCAMYPTMELYPWQAQELYRISGYVNGTPSGPRIHWSSQQPYFCTLVCCNDSGKDMVLVTSAAVGLPLLYHDTLVVVTSASHEQLKHQTNALIERGMSNLASRFGHAIYSSVEFYHRCAARGGEIKLFATDEAGRAEGWHPRSEYGRLVLIPNECKTISPAISTALDRCHGVSHRIEVSSPGGRSGWFYAHWRKSDKYELGAVPAPWRYFSRKVTCEECPHIPKEAVQLAVDIHGEESFLVQTSFRANFWEEEIDVIIPASYVDGCEYVKPIDGEISLALDCAAGGDETVLGVRRGNHVADMLAFVDANTDRAADRIDERLDPWRNSYTIFRLDDGGIGRGFADNLTKRGWRITKCHNQSTARNKQKYVNFGAECYGHLRDLFQAKLIPAPRDEKLRAQLITRKKVPGSQGRIKLQDKREIKADGYNSPDRADMLGLLYYDYRPGFDNRPPPPPEDPYADAGTYTFKSFKEAAEFYRQHPHFDLNIRQHQPLNQLFRHEHQP